MIGDRFTWIDFDGDLDSLLLAVSDPESRIRTSDACPSMPQRNLDTYLEEISFELRRGSAASEQVKLFFSPGYNGIVGSRGSGKTMLARILSKRDLSAYSQFVDESSIRYKMVNCAPTANVPRFLYLKQGDLESLYRDERYSDVPMLKGILESVEKKVAKASNDAFAEIRVLLDLQKDLVSAFARKYPSGVLSLDCLEGAEPSGILVGFPACDVDDDSDSARKAKQGLEGIADNILAAEKVLSGIHLSSGNAESTDLFKAANDELSLLRAELGAFSLHRRRIEEAFAAIADSDVFVERKSLGDEYEKVRGEHNRVQSSAALANYRGEVQKVSDFLYDLLKLRMCLIDIDRAIECQHSLMLEPIPPILSGVGGEKIEIELSYDGCASYREAVDSLMSPSLRGRPDALCECCLAMKESKEVKRCFNGQKVKKSESGAGGLGYVAKFTSILLEVLEEGKTLKEVVSVGGVKLDDMSPGMRAEALLKLFLDDKVVDDQYVFVVIDQPEDNLDTDTIGRFLIDRIKNLKLNVQLFVVSHSAPVIVNGDARAVVVCKSDGDAISYRCGTINGKDTKQDISKVLDGGERYIKMRLNKYNFKVSDVR